MVIGIDREYVNVYAGIHETPYIPGKKSTDRAGKLVGKNGKAHQVLLPTRNSL
jgi:hypothetical protein